jgi:hypothetical protein
MPSETTIRENGATPPGTALDPKQAASALRTALVGLVWTITPAEDGQGWVITCEYRW